MAAWVRNLVMLAVTLVWAAYMVTSIVRGTPIDAIAWGVPGAVYLALNPTFRTRPDPPASNGRPAVNTAEE